MLDFFRRNQKIFFLIVTVVIVVTFVFFGTFQTTPREVLGQNKVFTAIDGREVSRIELQNMVSFLSSDAQDQQLWGMVWGPNFLNDGVVVKDFLQTSLAQMLVEEYIDELRDDLQMRQKRERTYKTYVHPEAKFLSAQTVWAYFAPDLRDAYENMMKKKEEKDAFDARIRLFLEERKFPPGLLRHILRVQEQQYQWIMPDPDLLSSDLSLFTYKSLDDWFGRRFLELLSQFIINASVVAQDKGYYVSYEEAQADFVRNSSISYEKFKNHPYIGVSNAQEYLKEQLRRLGIDQSSAVSLWQKVMLFRRLFNDVGDAVFLDLFSYQKFQNYARRQLAVDLYQLPAHLRFVDSFDLLKFETYLNKVSKRKDLLELPREFLSLSKVKKASPEFVARRYLLRYSEVDKKALQVKVGLKETWDWQLDEKNWQNLAKRYPELKEAKNPEDRFQALEDLEMMTRVKIDEEARQAIVDSNPEWLQEALEQASVKQEVLTICSKGGKLPFKGIEDRSEFLSLLNTASRLDQEDAVVESMEAAEMLGLYSADDRNYYKILVLDRDEEEHILSYEEALAQDLFEPLIDGMLQKDYQGDLPKEFYGQGSEKRSFEEVKSLLVERRLTEIFKATLADDKDNSKNLLVRRFHDFISSLKYLLSTQPAQSSQWLISDDEMMTKEGRLGELLPLDKQWRLQKTRVLLKRKARHLIDPVIAFSMPFQTWSEVYAPQNGDLHFYQVQEMVDAEEIGNERLDQGQRVLANDAKRFLMQTVLKKLAEKRAISFDHYRTLKE